MIVHAQRWYQHTFNLCTNESAIHVTVFVKYVLYTVKKNMAISYELAYIVMSFIVSMQSVALPK